MQFEPLDGLRTPQLGFLWQRYRDRFPKFEERLLLDPSVEQYGGEGVVVPTLQLQPIDGPPAPRLWFISRDDTRLIQVQRDRFVHNWRKVTDAGQYPRYREVRETFGHELEEFRHFLDAEKLGELVPNQCEVTYVNNLVAGAGWDRLGELDEILAIWSGATNKKFLPEPEDVSLAIRYPIRDEAGRPMGNFKSWRRRLRRCLTICSAGAAQAAHSPNPCSRHSSGEPVGVARVWLDSERMWRILRPRGAR